MYLDIREQSSHLILEEYKKFQDFFPMELDIFSFKNPTDTLLSASGKVLCFKLFDKYNLDANLIRFSSSKRLHVLYKGGCNLYLSISHSKNITIVALSDNPIGIDLQYTAVIHEDSINMIYSHQVANAILINENWNRHFHQQWTRTEALYKVSGKYITDILLTNFNNIELDNDCFLFKDCFIENDYIFTMAVKSSNDKIFLETVISKFTF